MIKLETLFTSLTVIIYSYGGYTFYNNQPSKFRHFSIYILFSFVSYFFTLYMIPKVKEMTLKRGIKGKDINKKGTKEGEVDIPEALGIVPATIFSVFCMIGIAFLR